MYSANGTDWTALETAKACTTSFTELSYDIPSGGQYFKIAINSSSTFPSKSNVQFSVDDVTFTYATSTDESVATTTTIDASGITNKDVYVSTTAGTLTATVTPEGASALSNPAITWTSSKPGVATVDASGAVTLVAAGTTTITATYGGDTGTYKGSSAEYELVVTSSAPYTQPTEDITFAFNNTLFGTSYNGSANKSISTLSATVDNVVFDYDRGTSDNSYLNDSQMRCYSGNTIKFTAPSGYELTSIAFNGGSTSNWKVSKANDADFTATTWTGSASSVTFEFSGTTYLTKAVVTLSKQKSESDLAKKSDIVLDFKNDETMADVTDYITSSSTGAYTFEVGDSKIIENADELITALKVGSTSVTVTQAADANYKAGEVTINVTVNDSREPATTIPAINITTLTDDAEAGTISVVGAVKADEGVTFAFSSSNEDVLSIVGTTYTVGEAGTTTITVTATPSDTKLYTPVKAEFEVTVNASVKSENELELVLDATTAYGTVLEGLVSGSTGFDGTITATSSNVAVATVSVSEDGDVTVIPVAVGTTTLTFSAAETGKFLAAEDVTMNITVTAPSATNEAPAGEAASVVFEETYANCSGTGEEGSFSGTGNDAISCDNQGWTNTKANAANGCGKFGSGSAAGSATTPAISVVNGKSYVLTFKAAPWNAESTTKMKVSVSGGTITGISEDAMTTQSWNSYEAIVTATAESLTITFAASANRFFLDDVILTAPAVTPTESVTLNASGYLAYASQRPLDFTNSLEDGYSAWKVTGISGSEITFERIAEAIAGGQGILLKGDAKAEISIPLKSSETVPAQNLLKATLAPTYFEDETIYALSGEAFYLNAPCTLKANRAYLDADDVNASAGVKAFTLRFVDTATGVETVEHVDRATVQQIFNLAGQRVQKPVRGINIVNGKKVFVK